ATSHHHRPVRAAPRPVRGGDAAVRAARAL
ncbi:MAG: hypothetical protein AVDCRST_MAG20-859, partial [uncultured Acidimicrobiales bacterium]